jgi:serine/threonine protein kinase/Tfp pilus assembly protein PilF
MATVECRSDADLKAFLLGELPEALSESISQHLDGCAKCAEALQRLDALPDSVLRSIRQALANRDDSVTQDLTAPAAPSNAPGAPATLPRQVAGYVVLEEIGRGGMSVVYKALQTQPARIVALKMLLAGSHAEPERLARFLAEADAIARLQHPQIVQIYEVGQHEGLPFLALEHVAGGSLAQRLGGTPLPSREAATLLEQVARAVQYAHENGVVHRDLKPGNILLSLSREPSVSTEVALAEGSRLNGALPKITDFGLAKQERSDLTATGAIVGTPAYMAPEQALGHNRVVGPAADVYALGAMLYEMLTGRPPFQGATPLETLEQIVVQEPVPPSQLQGKTPRDLSIICLKCLQKEPRHRYASAGALADDVRRFLDHQPIRARRTPWHERMRRWCRRNPVVAGLLAAVAVVLVLGSTISTWEAVRANSALTRTRAAERMARLREAEALVGQAHGIRYSRRAGQRFDALTALGKATAIGREIGQPPQWFDRLRNEAIAALALPDVHITRELGNLPPDSVQVDVSDDFELYARTTDKGGCIIRRVADDGEVATLPELGEPASVAFGPGRQLVLQGQKLHRCQLWDLSGSQPVRRIEEPAGVVSWSFRRDGRLLVLGRADGGIQAHATDTGECLHRLAPGAVTKSIGLAVHPTEPVVAVFSYFSNVLQLRDLRTGAVVASLTLPCRGAGAGDWSPDGTTLAMPEGDNRQIHFCTFDPFTSGLRLTRTVEGPGQGGPWLTYGPAGDRFVTRGANWNVHLFDAVNGSLLFSTRSLRLAAGHKLHFDRTGQRLAAARVGEQNDRIGLWSVADGREYRSLIHAGSGGYARAPAIHPQGRLAACVWTRGATLFDLESGRSLAEIRFPGANFAVAFDGVGNLLTNSFGGLYRWPVRPDPDNPRRLRVGPAERLPFNPGGFPIAASKDGQVIAQSMYNDYGMSDYAGGWILHGNANAPRWVDARQGITRCSVSPDGRWVAFSVHEKGIDVFEAATGRRVWQSPVEKPWWSGHFSADGRWLVTNGDRDRLFAVSTWEPGPQLGSGLPWGTTAELAVLGLPNGIYRLLDLATGRELARFEDPEQQIGEAALTPDGTKLVVTAPNGLRVWDLRRIREELKKLDLDWDAPPYPPAPPPAPLEVQVDRDELEDDQALGSRPTNGDLCNLLVANSLILPFSPFDAPAYRLRGRAEGALRLARAAIADYSVTLALLPADDLRRVNLLGRRAGNYLDDQDFDRGLADIQEAERIDPLHGRRIRATQANILAQRASQRRDRAAALLGLRKAVDLDPELALAHNYLAWLLVTRPQGDGDAADAVRHARQAVELAGDETTHLNTLGIALYRNGQFAEALPVLEKSLAAGQGRFDAFDLFFLAMCHTKQKNDLQARECYDRAVKWCDAQKNLPTQWAEDLKAFQAEAEALLPPK